MVWCDVCLRGGCLYSSVRVFEVVVAATAAAVAASMVPPRMYPLSYRENHYADHEQSNQAQICVRSHREHGRVGVASVATVAASGGSMSGVVVRCVSVVGGVVVRVNVLLFMLFRMPVITNAWNVHFGDSPGQAPTKDACIARAPVHSFVVAS